MKVAYFYPRQVYQQKDVLWHKYTDHQFLHQKCDKTVDLIYSASVSTLAQAVKAKQQFSKPLICWVWDIPWNWRDWKMSPEGMAANAGRDKVNAARVELLKECDLVISASKWTQNVLKTQYGILSEQIYFFIDVHGIDSVPQPEKKKAIVQISRYFYNKKFEHTILAARDLKDYTTILIGNTLNSAYGAELKRCARAMNSKVVFCQGIKRSKVISYLKSATILTSPSVFEGWGITPIEALYCKVPVLLSDLEVFKEVYGDAVLYHDRNSVQDMKEKLERLVVDVELQDKIVRDCQPIISEFTPEKFAKRWMRIVK